MLSVTPGHLTSREERPSPIADKARYTYRQVNLNASVKIKVSTGTGNPTDSPIDPACSPVTIMTELPDSQSLPDTPLEVS
jgi:hypothetical protein